MALSMVDEAPSLLLAACVAAQDDKLTIESHLRSRLAISLAYQCSLRSFSNPDGSKPSLHS